MYQIRVFMLKGIFKPRNFALMVVSVLIVVAASGSLLMTTKNTLGLELIESPFPIGGGKITYYNSQDSIVLGDTTFYHAAKDTDGVWIHYDSLDFQGKLHYYLIDEIYSAWDADRDGNGNVAEDDEVMDFSPDSSSLHEGVLVFYGKSLHKYIDYSIGEPIVDTIQTRAVLTFRTHDDEPIPLEDSIPELGNKPALRVTENFKVNVVIEAQAPEKGNVYPKGAWFPAIALFDSLPNYIQDPLYESIYTGFSPRFYYDISTPETGNVTVSVKSPTSIEVCWDPPSANTDSIMLEVKTNMSDGFELLKTFPVNDITCYLHTDLDSSAVYSYRIRGINVNGESENSNPVAESTANNFTEIAGTTSGYTPVNAQVNESGGVSASIPITIPSGTSGMQPQLSLSINHNSGEPSIGGLSVISRVPRTYAQDDIIDGIHFNWLTDRYALDGERLVAVDGPHGAPNTKYRTEQETFQQVISNGDDSSGPTSFIVKTKDGLTKYYGYTEDSKIELGGDKTKIMYWLLNKVEDVVGNYFTITYEEDSENGFYRPSRIDYTGNEDAGLATYCQVKFEYEDRPDVFERYMLGDKIKNTKRLKSVDAYYENKLVRKYVLDYSQNGMNEISHLHSVTEYGSNGINFAPTVFDWYDENSDNEINAFSTPDTILTSFDGIKPYSNNGLHERFLDLNNDGKSDYLFVPEGESDLYAALSNGTGFDQPTKRLLAGIAGGKHPYSKDGRHEHFADFNGDNYIDYAWVPSGSSDLWVTLGDGISFQSPSIWLNSGSVNSLNPFSNNGYHEYFLDFDGDGRSDYLFFPENGEDWYIAKSTGSGFETPKILIDKGDASGNSLVSHEGKYQAFLDVNSDGYLDYVYRPDGTDDIWAIRATSDSDDQFKDAIKWLSAGSAEGSHPYSNDGKYESYADVNGDGLADKVWKPSNKDKIYVALSNGNGFETPISWLDKAEISMNVHSSEGRRQSFIDVNRDGFSDFLYYPEGGNGVYVAYSTGSSFSRPEQLMESSIKDISSNDINTYSNNMLHERYADINGDGVADKVWVPSGKDELFVSFLSASNPLLRSITNGHGSVTEFEYKPLTDESIYERGNLATYPYLDFQGPIYVASKLISNDGIGGRYSVQYKYFNAQLEIRGRGFRGFDKTETIDLETSSRSEVYFNRGYEYVGAKVDSTREYAPDGTLISQTNNTLNFSQEHSGVFWSHIEKTKQTSYELDGTKIKSTTTYYEYDRFGNPIYIEVEYGNGFKDITENVYSNDENDWHLGRLISATVERKVPDQPALTRSSTFEYNSRTGMLKKEIVEPDSELKVEKEYVHDKYGNVIESYTTGSGETRSHKTKYDEDKGRFVIESTNDLGHSETTVREPYYGQPISITGPNGLTTYFKYDGFGRKTEEIRADGNVTRMVYRLDEGNEVPNAVYYLHSETTGTPPSVTYYDILDRVIRTVNIGFEGNEIYTDVEYNHLGQVAKQSDPHSGSPLWTTYEYDIINRPIKTTAPDGNTSSVEYQGLTTNFINPKGQSKTHLENVVGHLVRVTDYAGKNLDYEYDAFGNLTVITDAAGNHIDTEYDIRGNKTQVVDPDMGTFEYTYNAFGELTSQTYPEGNKVELKYDKLSRLVQRSEPEGTTTWTYDNQEKGKGKLAKIETDGYSKELTYDVFGRPSAESTKLGDETYTTSNIYDAYGRVQQVIYPSGMAVMNHYNEYGYLQKVSGEDGSTYWQADSYNDRGQSTHQTYGNGVQIEKAYNNETGLIEEIKSSNEHEKVIQHLKMTYDEVGNITSRSDEIHSLKEDFEYDDINRLISSKVEEHNAVTLKYDAIGNITYKSDVGGYTYGENGAGPHAVTSISSDNCPSFQIEDIDYYSFQKVRGLSKDSVKLHYDYGPDRMRYRSIIEINGKVSQTKTYIGSLYEHIVENDSTKEQHYIHTPEGVVAVDTKINNAKSDVRYLHKDHLGSIQTVTGDNGVVLEVLSFDAWGKPRNAETWEPLEVNPETLFDRGFTMHELMSLFSLVNMNGRIYDPVIGRFISADPFIDGITDLQGYNRFSYVRNNPLTLVDPSGYGWFSKIWKSVKKTVKKVGKAVGEFWDKHKVTIISIGAGIVTGGIGAAIGSAIGGSVLGVSAGIIGSGFGFGFGSATAGALMSGATLGDALKAGIKQGIISGVTAAAAFGIGEHFRHATDWGNIGQKIASHGVVQGVTEIAQGGKFEHGFLASATGSISGFATSGMNSIIGRTAIAAVVGGTASVIGGGKFANGAQSAAFVALYNDMGSKLVYAMVKGAWKIAELGKDISELHLARNKYNISPNIDIANVDPSKGFTDNSGLYWQREPDWKNKFHGPGSVKYVHVQGNGSSEAIYNNGKWITSGKYKATYNYYHPQGIKGNIGHFLFDMIPHFISSNYE